MEFNLDLRLYVLQFAGEMSFVSAEIEQAMAGKVEKEHAFLPGLPRFDRFLGDRGDRVRGFRRGHDAFRAREQRPLLENFCPVMNIQGSSDA